MSSTMPTSAKTPDTSPDSDDIELNPVLAAHLINTLIPSFSWQDMRVMVKDHATGAPLAILDSVSGHVKAGEMLAIMGPSGSGKTTLLNVLAHRQAAAGAETTGQVLMGGQHVSLSTIRDMTVYVEQEDALIGSLTVRETMIFAARLALPSSVSRKEAFRRVDDLIASFGLQSQANTIVGTPIKKGLSGGQKKRLGVASRLMTNPNILFLDEPTSGLDSALSYEVIKYIKDIGHSNNLIVIASIHQPSTSTYTLFDKLCLMSKGRTCYFGNLADAPQYFSRVGYPMPPATNPAEFLLDLVNTDLDKGGEVVSRVEHITTTWPKSPEHKAVAQEIGDTVAAPAAVDLAKVQLSKPSPWMVPIMLLHRSWVKSYRDVVVYGIRVAMYLGLAILMGTVFLRLESKQEYIFPYINAIFFGGAFMSFMAVAYVPAFLEDLHTYHKEHANGLVGPESFMVANFIIGLPFLFLITVLFSSVTYWLGNFRPDGVAFMRWILWLFLDLVAAESLVVLVSVISPVFVVALAIAAFLNGLWMCVDGFLVPMDILNAFWKYVFHYIDYQAYVFQGMMVNEFKGRVFDCAKQASGAYACMYVSDLNSEGKIDGVSILSSYNIKTGREGEWFGIMIGIIVGYRIIATIALRFLKH